MINVAVIIGSPRKNGNTVAATDILLKYLSQLEPLSIKRFDLSNLNISHCRGCNVCGENGGQCVIIDGMVPVYEAIDDCDMIIMATPIYFSGPSSYLKQMIDRCQCLWMRGTKQHSKCLGIMIAVSGQTEANFKNSRSIIKSFLNTIGAEWGGELIFSGYDDCGELAADESAIKRCQEYAKDIHCKFTDYKNLRRDEQ